MTGKPQALEPQFDTAQFYDGGSRQSSNLQCYRRMAKTKIEKIATKCVA